MGQLRGVAATELAGGEGLAGRYAYVRELGRGASGRVVLVRDLADGGVGRALKVVGPADAARLGWEFETLRRIAHPHVARVHELLRLDARVGGAFRLEAGSTVLVEEHVEGEPSGRVADRLRADPERLVRWVLALGEAVARGLSAVHAAGLVHGDVKPSNVVSTEGGASARLVDLGLARPPGAGGSLSGTPAYLAPEAWHGERTLATDLYALGATLHHLLGGRSPLSETRSASVAELVEQAFASPRDAATLPASVAPPLRRLVASLLDPEPSRRPGTAREVAARVAAIAADLGVGEAAGGGIEDAPTPAERAMAFDVLPLVGRDRELDALVAAVRRGGVVALVGPPGAGRTRLGREAVQTLQRARAAAGETVPTSARSVAGLPYPLPSHDAVLHVEMADCVASDEARAAVRAAEVEGVSLAVILERDEPAAGADATVALGPIDRRVAASLLGAALGGRPPAKLADAAVRASGGLPGRLCRLLAQAVLDDRDPSRAETLDELGARPGGRVAVVPAPARAAAELLAVAGGALHPEAVDPTERAALGSAFALLSGAGLASIDPDGRLSLRRDVARHVRRDLAPARRREIAAKLAGRPLDEAALAYVLAARDERDRAERAFCDAVRGRRAAGDPEGAAQLAEEASWLIESSSLIALERADALRACGRYEAALDALGATEGAEAGWARSEVHRLRGDRSAARLEIERALEGAHDDDARARCLAALGRLALDEGRLDEARERLSSAGGGGRSDGVRARVAEVAALVALYSGRTEEATAQAGTALEAARRAGDVAAEARATALEAMLAQVRGEVRGAVRRYVRAFELADGAGEAHAAASFLVNVGLTRLDAGEPGPAIAALRDGARRLALLGRDQDLARALYNLGLAAVLVGDDDLARSAMRHARGASERCGDAEAEAYATVLEAEMALRAGSLAAARAAAERAEERGSAYGPRVRAVVDARRAMILAALGDRERAEQAVRSAREAAEAARTPAVSAEQRVAEARVALLAGDLDAARAAAAEGRAEAERAGTWEARLRSLLASGDVADAAGEPDEARRRFAEARSLLDAAQNGLSPSARARLRAVPAYQKALSTVPDERGAGTDAGERWRRLAFFARRLTAERRVGRLYEEIADAAVELSGAERGLLILREDDGGLRVRVARGLSGPAEAGGRPDEFSRSIAARAIDGGLAVSTVDAVRDERMDGAASVHALSLRSILAVPLRRRGEVAGALYLEDRLRPGAFGPGDAALVGDLADLASIALDGAELLRAERRNARRLSVLRRRLARTVETQALEIASLRRATTDLSADFPGIVAHSASMRRALDLVARVADSDVPVLVTGESGTGKELVARALHDRSARQSAPFVGENCGAIPEALLESALFGHVRGAFTGADRARVGLFEAADGGTLFLDEIGEMSQAMQTKLLRAVQEGEIRPVGSETVRRVNVRVVAATHRDLEEMVREGRFREDLYWRLAVVVVRIPPLRERPEDVAPLVAHLVAKHAQGREVRLDRRALARLSAHPWPGNVRQLENEVQRALVLASDVVREEDLSPALRGEGDSAPDAMDLKGQIQALERRLIRRALEASGGNQTQAAKLLGVSRYGLQKMMKRLGL